MYAFFSQCNFFLIFFQREISDKIKWDDMYWKDVFQNCIEPYINTLRDDYYVFDQDAYELRGDMTGKIFRLGQKVRVRVADADKMLKTVDFVLAEED